MARRSVLIASFSTLVSDARVLKQVRLLSSAYDVTTCGYGPAPDGVVAHVEIPADRVYWRRNRALLVARQYRRAYWGSPAVRYLRERLPVGGHDVIVANDIDTIGLALSLAPRCGVHADLHEYSPREKEDLRRWRYFVAPYMRWLVRTFVTRAASVTTVAEGIAREYGREFGVSAGVVTNATPAANLVPTDVHDPIALVHAGAARPDRYLETLFDAMELVTRPMTLDLYLTPNEPSYLASLRERARATSTVRVHDGVPYGELIPILNRHDVGVHVLPPVNFNNEWALPNKFFDFVQARLAVVVGPSREMAERVSQFGLGVVTEDFTPQSLARALDQLSAEDVRGYKAAAHAAAGDLSAERQVQVWRAAVDDLVAGCSSP
jgi:hypothetical protein